MERYGIIVEGDYDNRVYKKFIMKINPETHEIMGFIAYGCPQLMKKFPSLLEGFKYGSQGYPVDKALVIRDWDGKNPALIESRMRESIAHRNYTFPGGVGLHAVKQEMETWLLADSNAIDRVVVSRGGKKVSRVPDPLEEIQNPKERLMAKLSESGLNYTAEVCREIAKETDLITLRMRCPSFAAFEEKVLDP